MKSFMEVKVLADRYCFLLVFIDWSSSEDHKYGAGTLAFLAVSFSLLLETVETVIPMFHSLM